MVGGSGLCVWSDCPCCFQLTGILLFFLCLGLTHDSRWRRRLGLFRLRWNWDEPPLYSYLCWCLFEQFHERLIFLLVGHIERCAPHFSHAADIWRFSILFTRPTYQFSKFTQGQQHGVAKACMHSRSRSRSPPAREQQMRPQMSRLQIDKINKQPESPSKSGGLTERQALAQEALLQMRHT